MGVGTFEGEFGRHAKLQEPRKTTSMRKVCVRGEGRRRKRTKEREILTIVVGHFVYTTTSKGSTHISLKNKNHKVVSDVLLPGIWLGDCDFHHPCLPLGLSLGSPLL